MARASLRRALLARYPWLARQQFGPASVTAGECDRCGAEARLVATCGPGPGELGRRCAAAVGVEAWCAGHEEEAAQALAWLAALPEEADVVARLWWVATGEIRLDPALVHRLRKRLQLPD